MKTSPLMALAASVAALTSPATVLHEINHPGPSMASLAPVETSLADLPYPIVHSVSATPSYIGYAGATVHVHQFVTQAKWCQLKLLSRQYIPIIFASNYRSCAGFHPVIRIGQNPTDAQRTLSFELIAYNGYHVERGYFFVTMANNYINPDPNPPYVPKPSFTPPPSSVYHAPPPPPAPPARRASSSPAAGMGAGYDTSENWSGYELLGSGFHSVQGTFTVPSLQSDEDCQTAESQWVGIDGGTSDNNNLIQAGVQETPYGDDGYGSCQAPNYFYVQAWWEILPAYSTPIDSMTVSAGDSVTVSINPGADNLWSISLTDDTTGQNFTTQQYYFGPDTSAEWITEAFNDTDWCSGFNATDGVAGQCQMTSYSPAVRYSGLSYNYDAQVDQFNAETMNQYSRNVSVPSPVADLGDMLVNGFTTSYQ